MTKQRFPQSLHNIVKDYELLRCNPILMLFNVVLMWYFNQYLIRAMFSGMTSYTWYPNSWQVWIGKWCCTSAVVKYFHIKGSKETSGSFPPFSTNAINLSSVALIFWNSVGWRKYFKMNNVTFDYTIEICCYNSYGRSKTVTMKCLSLDSILS